MILLLILRVLTLITLLTLIMFTLVNIRLNSVCDWMRRIHAVKIALLLKILNIKANSRVMLKSEWCNWGLGKHSRQNQEQVNRFGDWCSWVPCCKGLCCYSTAVAYCVQADFTCDEDKGEKLLSWSTGRGFLYCTIYHLCGTQHNKAVIVQWRENIQVSMYF